MSVLHLLGQTYSTQTTSTSSSTVGGVLVIVYLAIIVLLLVSIAKVYIKAGRKWWEAIVPIYNIYVLQLIVGRPGWWTVLYFVPIVNIVVSIINAVDLAKAFGKGVGTALVLIFLPFIGYPMMAFSSDYHYKGAVASAEGNRVADTPYPTNTTSTSSDATGPQPPTHTEPAPSAPEPPASTPPEDPTK
jgi:hypothetical protein